MGFSRKYDNADLFIMYNIIGDIYENRPFIGNYNYLA